METLTPQQAQAAFADLSRALPKQHLRLQFRKRFGTGELLDAKLLHRSTVLAAKDKPVVHLLQETPEELGVLRMTGTPEQVSGEAWTAQPDASIGDLISREEVEQALIVQGRKARLYAYVDPTQEGAVYVLRVSIELPSEAKPLSRSKRAAARSGGKATARKPARKTAPRRK